MRTALLLFTSLALLLAACAPASEVRVPIAEVAASGVTGNAVLAASGSGTIAKLELRGLKAAEMYRVQLQAGTLEQPSASFTLIAEILADKDGFGSAEAPVRFRGEDLDLATVADGSRILVVQGASGTVAVGAIAPRATPTAIPTAGAGPAWQRLTGFPSGPDGSAVTGLTAGGPGFVAVGFDGDRNAMVWVSGDGRSWSAVPHAPAFENAVMAGVTRIGERLVAFGRDVTSPDQELAAAWVSDDGLAWQRVPGDGLDGGQLIRAIPGGPGLIAVGSAVGMDAAAVWLTADGERWERVAHTAALDHAFMWNVTRTSRSYVAVGWRRAPDPVAAVWTSPDGREWSLAPPLPGGEDREVRTVLALGDRLVAAGSVVQGGDAAVWTSLNGRVWTRSPDGPHFAGAGITTLLLGGDGVIALGGRGLDAAAWTSAEGTDWRPLESDSFGGAYLTSGAASDDQIVAGGATQRQIPGTGSFIQNAAVWVTAGR